MSYGYAPQYVTEEQEMSESDCPSDGQVGDFTEIYRRKHQAQNAGSYYYTHLPRCFEQSRLATCACNLPFDPRFYYYNKAPKEEGMFRSTTHVRRDTKCASGTIKKYPVTARTPRYYRCPTTSLCKRPSALCLPVTCQPDPAFFHRPRKTEDVRCCGQDGGYAANDYVVRAAVKRSEDPRPVDSEGDVNSRLNDLENLLTKFDDDDLNEDENETMEISGVNDIAKILKPKVPASVKAKQEKMIKFKAPRPNETTVRNVTKLEVKEAEEPLDVLLQRLSRESNNNKRVSDEKQGDCNNDNRDQPIPKSKLAFEATTPKSMCYSEQKPPLDDNSALELHKSKSYIVSLIDKALSRELGTVPGEKCSRKEFLSMSPKKAIELVNRHAAPKIFNTRAVSVDTGPSGSTKKDANVECRNEEPLYLRQLKQLRWSHLRHIQREAKRLADLERFLDSFGEIDSSL